jgi:hypothetical protein
VQLWKHIVSSDSTEPGITIDRSDEQRKNAHAGIERMLEPDSNVTDEIEVQPEKQELQRTSTERGIEIDLSDEQPRNANSPIRVKQDSDSNLITMSDLHSRKHCLQSRSIDRSIVNSAAAPKNRSKLVPS